MLKLQSVTHFLRFGSLVFLLLPVSTLAELSGIEVTERTTITDEATAFSYESITGVAHFVLDPEASQNLAITDISFAPKNANGLVEFSADFRVLVPSADIANGGLLYNVNNRGGSRFPPEISLSHPLSELGFTYLATGWINELTSGADRLRLHAPIVTDGPNSITGPVRYEVSVSQPTNVEVDIAGGNHLAYPPTEAGLANATLTRRLYQNDPRIPIERSRFSLNLSQAADSNQPSISLHLADGFEPGVIYELIYEAKDPVLAGAGMAAIRDFVSAIRFESNSNTQLTTLALPAIEHTVAWGNSQSGRLLRQFMYDGFNADLAGRQVFDGIIPVIAGGGYGMFNNRFAMPTRTNGQHSNYLYPNDLFPFTYGESTDPFTGVTDSVLGKSRASGTVPKVMHIQTSNEYWVRAGSLPHTNPQGTSDAVIPDEVRFYTIGGSQHGSGSGRPREASSGQLPPNPNMWSPIADSLLVAMYDWVANGIEPPASRYPKIADGTLVESHQNGRINQAVWKPIEGINHPEAIYQPAYVDYGDNWRTGRIVEQHPEQADTFYKPLVPAVNSDNNDFATSTILPPLTQVPLATFVPWNLRAVDSGAPRSLARLSGGYIPLPLDAARAQLSNDFRSPIANRYDSFADYLEQYEAATDRLIDEGYLLPGFKQSYMAIAEGNRSMFDR